MRKLILAAALMTAGCNSGFTGVSTGGVFLVAVGTEQFRVRIDNAFLATTARRMAAGQDERRIITGEVASGDGGFNTGYHWHITPSTTSFTDVVDTTCDGLPSAVEKDVAQWIATKKKYCPQQARIVREESRI
jgi:hypothetical protein